MLLEFGILVFDVGSMVLVDLKSLATDKPICCILSKKRNFEINGVYINLYNIIIIYLVP